MRYSLLLLICTISFETNLAQDSLNCQLLSSTGPENAVYGLTINKNLLYSVYENVFSIFDVSNPKSPVQISKIDTFANNLWCVTIDSNYAFLGGNGMIIVDISNPQFPIVISEFRTDYNQYYLPVEDIAIQGNFAYLGITNYMFLVVDISNLNNPTEITRIENIDDVWDIEIQDTLLFAASEDTGTIIYSIANPSNPVELSRLGRDQYTQGISVKEKDKILYVSDDTHEVYLIDIENPNEPIFLSKINSGGIIDISDDFLYILDWEKLFVFDVSNKYFPVEVGYYSYPFGGFDIAVKENIAFAGSQVAGTMIIQYDKPTDIVENENSIEYFSLSPNYPNPFNPTTNINYTINKSGMVRLKVCDLLGKEISTLVNKYQNQGNYKVEFNGQNLSSGIYFYSIRVNGIQKTKSMVLLR